MAPKKTRKGAALVTGGAKRVGKAICLALAEAGYDIALHYNRSEEEASSLAEEIEDRGGICETFRCDLSNARATSSLIGTAHKTFPGLNLLVNSASIFEKSSFRGADNESFRRHMATNLQAPFILSRDFANICGQGQIINILDTNIVKNKTAHFTYLLSKKALHALTELSALELAPDIRVNAIAPGFILPPVDNKKTNIDRLLQRVPLKKQGAIEQILQSIEFFLTNTYLTGQIIYNDGGEHLT